MKKGLKTAKWGCCIVLISAFLLLSCGKGKEHEGVLSKREMAHIIIDNYLAESKIISAKISGDSTAILLKNFEISNLKKKRVSDSVLKLSFTYYLAQPEELAKIMDIVIDTLSLREQHFNKTNKIDSVAETRER